MRMSSAHAVEKKDTIRKSVDIGGNHAIHVVSMATFGPCVTIIVTEIGSLIDIQITDTQRDVKDAEKQDTAQQNAGICQSSAMVVECGVM